MTSNYDKRKQFKPPTKMRPPLLCIINKGNNFPLIELTTTRTTTIPNTNIDTQYPNTHSLHIIPTGMLTPEDVKKNTIQFSMKKGLLVK